MSTFEISPHQAIGPARLGASRAMVRQAMSEHGFALEGSYDGIDYFCESCLQVSYGPDDNAHFIGASGNVEFTFLFKGVNVFDTPATEVFSMMAALDESGEHDFDRYEYFFPNQILTLWEADEQYDRYQEENRVVWAQVGIGNESYVAAINAIKKKFG
jgi:hypothetical protein